MAKDKFNSKETKLNSRKADKLNKTMFWTVLYREEFLNQLGYRSRILRSIYGESIGTGQLKNLEQPHAFKNRRRYYGPR